jgi:ferrous iron transport protein A
MLLAKAPVSQPVKITSVRNQGPVGRRLMEMGLIEGASIEIIGRAPLGDPLHVRVGDYDLSLRSGEAELVDVVVAAA